MVSLEVELPDLNPENITKIKGVDVGQRYLAVSAGIDNSSQFFSGKEIRHKANRYYKARKSLQHKGTRSAKRKLITLSGRERRFIADINHQISKKIAQCCPRCGHVSKENRPNKGLTFDCKCCNYKLHADLVGARNIALRALLIRQDWMSTGILSASPDVSDGEAKAKDLQKFLELRWSLDTSLDFSDSESR